MSAVRKVEFVDGRMSHIMLRGGLCDLIILNLGMDWRIMFKMIIKKQDGMAWTGFIWFRIGTGGGLLLNTVRSIQLP
jgi:hypothetical protein